MRLLRWGETAVKELRQAHSGDVLRLSFSPDGSRLASGGADSVAIVHDVASGQPIARFSPHDDSNVDSVVFVEPGEVLVSGRAKGSRLVWDLRTGARLARLRDTGGTVKSVDISPNGRRVAVLRSDGSVALRDWDAATLQAQACTLVNRNLDCSEWRQYLPEEPYELTCPAQPAPKNACR